MSTAERLAPTSKMSLDLRAQIALLARMLHREGYEDHIMGHISHSLVDGSIAHDVEQAYLRAMVLEWRCRQAWDLGDTGVPMDPVQARSIGDILEERNFPGLFDAMIRRELRADPTLRVG
jgi:hypothetical protein